VTPEQWRRVRDLFEAALEQPPAGRRAWLGDQRVGDEAVRVEVESLLDHEARAGAFLAEPLVSQAPGLAGGEDALEAGAVIGQYTVLSELGRGAMGRVYLASDARLGRAVALKVIAPELTGDPSFRERLRREAQAAAALSHPGICTVYALEEVGERLFIASEAVEGHTLREEMASHGRPSAESLLSTARELAEALASAHAKGITHRDLKPENVMRDKTGRLKVLDFGLARMPAPPATPDRGLATLPGVLVGTPAYMAPEQLNLQPADARTDVFAFGVLMYEYACGAHPFDAATPLAKVARVLEGSASPLAERATGVPPILAGVIDRCLRKTPGDRYASAAEVVAALAGIEGRLPVPTGRRGRAAWWRTHQVAVVALYLGGATVAWYIKEAFRGSVSLWLFVALGVAAAVAGILRGHLVFTDVVNRPRLVQEWGRVKPMLSVSDAVVAIGLALDGLRIAPARPLWAVLTIALAVGVALAAWVMEPATTAAVFEDDRR
jgi:serine/threonine-protein kinase